jgi:hypothetical protein
LLKEFPNPERVGCPGAEVISGIASKRMPLSQAETYLDHLTSCSPCYRDFSQLREAYRRRRRQLMFAVAASVLIVAAIATWAVIYRHGSNLQVARSVVVDLRNHSMARGTEPLPSDPPLEISRSVSHLDIYLPLGSSDGPYDFRIANTREEVLRTGSGFAKVQEGITALPVDVNLSSVSPDLYILQIRKVGSEWNSYSLRLR